MCSASSYDLTLQRVSPSFSLSQKIPNFSPQELKAVTGREREREEGRGLRGKERGERGERKEEGVKQ
jgi:hypothetical protein